MLFPTSLLSSVPTKAYEVPVEVFRTSLRGRSYESFFEGLTDLVEYRDVAEDLLETYGLTENFTVPKSETRSLACSQALAVILSQRATTDSLQYKDFCLKRACEEFLDVTDPYITMRPRMKASIPELERLISEMEALDAPTVDHLDRWATLYGNSVLSTLSLYYCILSGIDTDDAFVNAPKSLLSGNVCTLRDTAPGPASIKACKKQDPDLSRAIVLYDGHLKLRFKTGFLDIVEPLAHYGVPVPGTDVVVNGVLRRYIVVAKGTTAAVLAITYHDTPTVQKKLEIDLQESTPIDFLDCQRDRDTNIVLLWGHRNHLTGSAEIQYFAWSEDEFLSKRMNLSVLDTHKLPVRTVPGTKIDYRDHGNLLALSTCITEDSSERRAFKVRQQILFGNTLVDEPTDRLLHIYGSPVDYVRLTQDGTLISKSESVPIPDARRATGLVISFL